MRNLQRLSVSVSMVARGVLKEHLMLLANSMTCGGNLIGFNSGGYKALSRSLNIQVPFTEATLFVSNLFHFVILSKLKNYEHFPSWINCPLELIGSCMVA